MPSLLSTAFQPRGCVTVTLPHSFLRIGVVLLIKATLTGIARKRRPTTPQRRARAESSQNAVCRWQCVL